MGGGGGEQGRFVLPGSGGGASKKGFEQGLEGIGVWSGVKGPESLRSEDSRS